VGLEHVKEKVMTAKTLASCLLLAASAWAAQISARLAGVLKGEVVQMGRDGRTLTVALKSFLVPCVVDPQSPENNKISTYSSRLF
jgi:hypothetical protein